MNITRQNSVFFLLGIALLVLCVVHLFSGLLTIHWSDYLSSILSYDDNNPLHVLIRELRIPRLVMAIVAGSSLSVAGLLMQNLFNNPLAGPNILGISTGSSLFVALAVMSGSAWLSSSYGIIGIAMVGAFLFGILILFFARFSKSHYSILLIGIMIGSFSGSIISVLQASTTMQNLKLFTMWSMGSLQNTSSEDIPMIVLVCLAIIFLLTFQIRSLNAFGLGEVGADNLGVSVPRFRLVIIGFTAILTAVTTAFCGPIVFVGLAVPNLVKMVFKTVNFRVLLPATWLMGALFLVFCDCIIQWLSNWGVLLPINAISALLGAPFVVFVILKRMP